MVPKECGDQGLLGSGRAWSSFSSGGPRAQDAPHFRLLQQIGDGPCGHVFTAEDNSSKQIVAVKIINIKESEWHVRHHTTWTEITKAAQAINASSESGISGAECSLPIRNMIPFGETLWITSPLCTGGNLKALMQPYGCLADRYLTYILRDLACALMWTHAQGSFHGNLKCSNILVDGRGRMRLCDFSLVARGALSQAYHDNAYQGSLNWLAPEYLGQHQNFEKSADVWGFGAVAWEAATGLPPFSDLTTASEVRAHLAKFGPPFLIGDEYSATLKHLVSQCFVINPAERPQIGLIMAHSYMHNIEVSSLQGLVDEYRHWQVEQAMAAAAGADSRDDLSLTPGSRQKPSQHDDQGQKLAPLLHESSGCPSPVLMQNDHFSRHANCQAEGSNENGEGVLLESASDGQRTEFVGDVGTSPATNPSRCSSPFDLEHLIQSDAGSTSPKRGNVRLGHGDGEYCSANSGKDAAASVDGVSVRGESNASTRGLTTAMDQADWIMEAALMNLQLRFSAAFNPDFDVFAPESVSTDSGSDILTPTTSEPMLSQSPRLSPLSSPSKVSSESLGPSLWDSPVIIPAQVSTSTSTTASVQRSAAPSYPKAPGSGTFFGGFLPPFTFRQRQRSPLPTTYDSEDGGNDDDDTSTVRPRDSQGTSVYAPTLLSTPPPTPERSVRLGGQVTASSSDAWPRLRMVTRSSYDLRSAQLSPPQTPGPMKPLPPLPSLQSFPGRSSPLRRPATSHHRPSTSGGSSSSGGGIGPRSFRTKPEAPPVPIMPAPLRRPSVDIFSPVNWTSCSPSFDTSGNYIGHPGLPPNKQYEEAQKDPGTRHVGKSKAISRERMIPREAGSCPPPRRKSHPTTTAREVEPTAGRPGHSASSSSSSSSPSSDRSPTRPPPRNASFSFFPSQSSNSAASAAAAVRTATSSSSGTANHPFPPRRPSAPLPSQHSFFDYDGDDSDDEGADSDATRRAAAEDFKRGVKRIVNSVSANLGGTIRGLETAPRKGLRWMKRSPI